MAEFIVPFTLGIVLIGIGISNMRGNLSTLHFYHRYRVAEKDRLPMGKRVGFGTILIGGAMMSFSALSSLATLTQLHIFTAIGTILLLPALVVGLVIILHAIIKYNGGLF